jgi:hypothetical protein
MLAFVALVYAGALSGGLVFHMAEEAAEVHAAVALGIEVGPGESNPLGHEVPDDLECLLCQVLASPSHLGPEAPTLAAEVLPATSSPVPAHSTQDVAALTRNARAPPFLT